MSKIASASLLGIKFGLFYCNQEQITHSIGVKFARKHFVREGKFLILTNKMKMASRSNLLFVLFSFPYDDCVNRFHEKKEQSNAEPPVLRILFDLNDQIHTYPTMGEKYNAGEDAAEEREKYHREWKP